MMMPSQQSEANSAHSASEAVGGTQQETQVQSSQEASSPTSAPESRLSQVLQRQRGISNDRLRQIFNELPMFNFFSREASQEQNNFGIPSNSTDRFENAPGRTFRMMRREVGGFDPNNYL